MNDPRFNPRIPISRRPVRLSELKNPRRLEQLSHVVANESLLVARIMREQDTLRLAKMIPAWDLFYTTEHWYDCKKFLSTKEQEKYRAWWNLILDLSRFPQDGAVIACATAYLVKEKCRRSYSKEVPVLFERWRLTPIEAAKIEEYVKSRYESLNPE